jgi:hypothetical protein
LGYHFRFDATRYRIPYENFQGSNGLITHFEEEAEATSTTKSGGTPDMNGEEEYGEDEEAGSGDDSDDVSPTSSISLTSTYCRAISAGCRNHHGTRQPLTRFPVRFFSFGQNTPN